MASVVKLEPGDILIISKCGNVLEEWADHDDHLEWLEILKDKLGLGAIMLFEGDVDLTKFPAGWTPDAVAGA